MHEPQVLHAQARDARQRSAQARDDLRRAKERLAQHALFLERSRASLLVRIGAVIAPPRHGASGGPPLRAVQNLGRLRAAIARNGGLGYFYDPRLRHHADRLVADAMLVGAYPFTKVLAGMAAVGGALGDELPYDGVLLDLLDELSAELLSIERVDRTLTSYLSDFEASAC